MRARLMTTVAAAAVSLLVAAAPAAAAPSAAAVPWTIEYGTAVATGERWTEGGPGAHPDLVVRGELANAGNGCYALWTRVARDSGVPVPAKQAEVCGTDTVRVDFVIRALAPTTVAHMTVCRGTEGVSDCAPYQILNPGPIGS